jgi:hypothetical protein
MKRTKQSQDKQKLSEAVARGMLAAARRAGKTARIYGTPVYFWEDGKVDAKKP